MRSLLNICAGFAMLGCAARAQPTPAAEPREVEVIRVERDQERAVRGRQQVERERARVQRDLERSRERMQRDAEHMRERARVVRERALSRARSDSANANRATLGVSLGGSGSKRDTLGIFVTAVVENGPAERAGIYEGDRIAAINGVDLRTPASDAGDAQLAGVAHRRLTREMQKLTAGSVATLRVWSGGRYKDVRVTTARQADVYKGRRFSFELNVGDGGVFIGRHPIDHFMPAMPVPPMPPMPPMPPAPPMDELIEEIIELDVQSIIDHARETLRGLDVTRLMADG